METKQQDRQQPEQQPDDSDRSGSLLGAYEQHLAALKRFVKRIIHTDNDVDDVVQEAFMRAYKTEVGGAIRQPLSSLRRQGPSVLNQCVSHWIPACARMTVRKLLLPQPQPF